MNDIRTTDINLTVDQLRIVREVLADMIDMDQNALENLEGEESYEQSQQRIRDMYALYIKVSQEVEKVVGVMA